MKLFVAITYFSGLIISLIMPIVILGFFAVWVWGDHLLYEPMKGHPSYYLFGGIAVPLMPIFAWYYVQFFLVPGFAKYKINHIGKEADREQTIAFVTKVRKIYEKKLQLLVEYEKHLSK